MTRPASTKPDATKPDASKPASTKPDASKPASTKPNVTKPAATADPQAQPDREAEPGPEMAATINAEPGPTAALEPSAAASDTETAVPLDAETAAAADAGVDWDPTIALDNEPATTPVADSGPDATTGPTPAPKPATPIESDTALEPAAVEHAAVEPIAGEAAAVAATAAEPKQEPNPETHRQAEAQDQADSETQPQPETRPQAELEAQPQAGLRSEPPSEAEDEAGREANPVTEDRLTHEYATVDEEEPVTRSVAGRETVLIAVPERGFVPEPAPATDDERPFWMPMQEVPRGASWPPPQMRGGRRPGGSVARRPGRPPKPPRRPAAGLAALLLLALLATFFSWVSAEPLWLAVGHSNAGTATVTECTGSGMGLRCLGEFTATGGTFTAERVRLLGVGDQRGEGSTVAARMVAADSGRAYVDAAGVAHLRWVLGMGLVLLCGVGIVWVTGATRLEDSRSRRRATLAGLAAPLLVAIGFLAATF